MSLLHHRLSSQLRHFRRNSELTQAQLSERIDVSIGYYTEIECGRKFPSPEIFLRLSNFFKVPPYVLLMTREEHADWLRIQQDWQARETLAQELLKEIKKDSE